MVDVVDGAGVDMDGAGQGVDGESSMSANEHKEWQLQDPAERPETPPLGKRGNLFILIVKGACHRPDLAPLTAQR
jgi:hypothetical protein